MFTLFDQQFFKDLTFVEYFEKYGFDQKVSYLSAIWKI
jgi:hypothetical protein